MMFWRFLFAVLFFLSLNTLFFGLFWKKTETNFELTSFEYFFHHNFIHFKRYLKTTPFFRRFCCSLLSGLRLFSLCFLSHFFLNDNVLFVADWGHFGVRLFFSCDQIEDSCCTAIPC